MELCSDGHDEVCFEATYSKRSTCPACQMIDEKDGEIFELERRITELEDKIKEEK